MTKRVMSCHLLTGQQIKWSQCVLGMSTPVCAESVPSSYLGLKTSSWLKNQQQREGVFEPRWVQEQQRQEEKKEEEEDHTLWDRLFKNLVCVSVQPSVCGWLRCQENNVFRLLGGLSHAARRVAPNTQREETQSERSNEIEHIFPF